MNKRVSFKKHIINDFDSMIKIKFVLYIIEFSTRCHTQSELLGVISSMIRIFA